MSVNPIHRALIDCMVFLIDADDSLLDPDAAIQQLEASASTLQGLPPQDRQLLVKAADQMASECAGPGGDLKRCEVLRSLFGDLGLS